MVGFVVDGHIFNVSILHAEKLAFQHTTMKSWPSEDEANYDMWCFLDNLFSVSSSKITQ